MTAGNSMPGRPITRRRAITFVGAAAGLPLLAGRDSDPAPPVLKWRGQDLGAEARLVLAQPEAARAAGWQATSARQFDVAEARIPTRPPRPCADQSPQAPVRCKYSEISAEGGRRCGLC